MKGTLLIGGTGSDVGKSVVVAGMCRWLARQGVRVAPFKAQNMSLTSAVTPDGGEIGRAQAAQALAAGIAPERAMNPVLIKPTADSHAQVIVMGMVECDTDAAAYQDLKRTLLPRVLDALRDLQDRFDVVICEGAGSVAEFNLRENDIANLGIARAAGIPVVLLGDIDKGGVFASFLGSLGLLDVEDGDLIKAFLINKFRGDIEILRPGLDEFAARTGRPFLGVIPWLRALWIDAEDALNVQPVHVVNDAAIDGDVLDVAVIALPRMSNFTDLDALAAEPNVRVRYTLAPADLLRADLCVLPGSKHTVGDLQTLRDSGVAAVLEERAGRGLPTIGICAGYQMLGQKIEDEVESKQGIVAGLGLLPVTTTFGPRKVLSNRKGIAPRFDGAFVRGYQIHNGRVVNERTEPLVVSAEGNDGAMAGATFGTTWHGIFDDDSFRTSLLSWVASVRGADWSPRGICFDEVRNLQIERVADALANTIDVPLLEKILNESLDRS